MPEQAKSYAAGGYLPSPHIVESLTKAEQFRCIALQAASRAFAYKELSTSGVLSSASQFETYLLTGLVRTGGSWQSAAEVGANGVSVMVEAPGLKPETVEAIRAAVKAALA